MKDKLSKSKIKRFSISFSEANKLGITDNDLKYITESSTNKFRVSVPNPVGKRKTRVVYELLDAIHLKYDFLNEIEKEKKDYEEKKETLRSSKKKITKYNTVRDGIELYLKDNYGHLDDPSLENDTYDSDMFFYTKSKYLLNSNIFDKIINDVDDDYAQEFVKYLRNLKTKDGKRLSENTIYKPFSFIHKIFNYFCDDLKIIDVNPFRRVKNKPHAEVQEKDYFTEEEMHYIHDMIEYENIRLRTLIIIMLDTGMRKEEALGLKYSDINNARRTAKIQRAFVKSKLDYKLKIKNTKTKASIREVILTNHALDLINKYKQFKQACGFVINDDNYIFTAWDSLDPIDPSRYSKEFTKFLKRINMPTIVPLKNLRTTNTTFFVAKGQNLKAIQKHAGHSTFDTTMTYYAMANQNEERKLANLYEETFYNKLGLNVSDLYKIVSNRFNNKKKLISIMEYLCDTAIDDSNYDYELERCQNYFIELFPIFEKILKIDSSLDEDDIDALFVGYTPLYLSIKIEPLEHSIKL